MTGHQRRPHSRRRTLLEKSPYPDPSPCPEILRIAETRIRKDEQIDAVISLNAIAAPGVIADAPESNFDAIEHSVYEGRLRLGRYARIAVRRYAAYDAHDIPLGDFRTRKGAWKAISKAWGLS